MNSPHISNPPPLKRGVLLSSETHAWGEDFIVEHRRHGAGEHRYASSNSHLICLHTGNPILLEQTRDGKTHTSIMPRGGLHILPAGVEGMWRHQMDADHLNIIIKTSFMRQVAADFKLHHTELQSHFHICDPRLEHICLALFAELTVAASSPGRMYRESLATSLSSLVLHAYANPPSSPPEDSSGLPSSLLQRIFTIIDDRLSEDLGLVELASEAGLSPGHFSNLFRKSTGLAPHQYIVRRRLEHAQNLLKTTRLSIGEIAYAVGFYDHSHLVRHMKRVMGITPGYFRDH